MVIPSSHINTGLSERLRARIEHDGPISFRDWMQAALYDEREGYYCRLDRIPQGRAGDYRTAPESSPLFAATLAWYFSKLFAVKWGRILTLIAVVLDVIGIVWVLRVLKSSQQT